MGICDGKNLYDEGNQLLNEESVFIDDFCHLYGFSGLDGVAVRLGIILPHGIVDGYLHLPLSLSFAGNRQIDGDLATYSGLVDVDCSGLLHTAEPFEKVHHDGDESDSDHRRDDEQKSGGTDLVHQKDGCPSEAEEEIDEVAECVEVHSAVSVK